MYKYQLGVLLPCFPVSLPCFIAAIAHLHYLCATKNHKYNLFPQHSTHDSQSSERQARNYLRRTQ